MSLSYPEKMGAQNRKSGRVPLFTLLPFPVGKFEGRAPTHRSDTGNGPCQSKKGKERFETALLSRFISFAQRISVPKKKAPTTANPESIRVPAGPILLPPSAYWIRIRDDTKEQHIAQWASNGLPYPNTPFPFSAQFARE